MLLGLEDEEVHEITLSFNETGSFSIQNGHSSMHGAMETNGQFLRLKYQHHHMGLKVLNKTIDSLVVESKGYVCGITNVTITFYRKSEGILKINSRVMS